MKREVELDFIRGIAILLALGWHFHPQLTGYAVLDFLSIPGRWLGWAGVDLFFVLSGYLVGGLVFSEISRTGDFKARRFLVRRAMKIWPVLYAYLALLLILGRYPWEQFIPQTLLHVQNYFETPLLHLWSLAVEEHFYLGLTLIAVFAMKSKWLRSYPNFAFYTSIASLCVVCLALRIFASSNGVEYERVHTLTHFRIDSLAFGVMLAHLKTCHTIRFENISRNKTLLFITSAAGWLFLAMNRDSPQILSSIGFSIAYVASASLLLYCYRHPALIAKPMPVRWLAALGVYSYALYIYQFVGIRFAEAAGSRFGMTPFHPIADWCLKYVSAIFLAIFVTRLLERPALMLRDHFFAKADVDKPPTTNAWISDNLVSVTRRTEQEESCSSQSP